MRSRSDQRTSNKYNDKKIVWFPDKLKSFIEGTITPPIYVRIKPTNRCCHNCFFCVYRSKNSGMHDTANTNDELSREKLLEIISDINDMGVKAVTYSGGGEPLLHGDIEEILEKTISSGIDLSIITNGQLLNGNRAEILRKSKWVRISMDYYNKESFSISRSVSSSIYDRIITNVGRFAEIKNVDCDLCVNFIITVENYKKIYQFSEQMKKMKIDNVRFSPVWFRNFYDYHSPLLNEVMEQLHRAKTELEDEKFKIYHSYFINREAGCRDYSKCFFMQIVPSIGADGNVYSCHNKSYTKDGLIGTITDKSFKQMWFSDSTRLFFDNFDPREKCRCQCANDKKNIFIHNLMDAYGDNFV